MTNVKSIKIGNKDVYLVMKGGVEIWPKYDPATRAILDYAGRMGYVKSSSVYIYAMDKYIKELKQEGLWGRFDLIYWMQGDGDAFFRCINLVNPEMSGTPFGGLILTVRGIEGNMVDGFINSNFNLSGLDVKLKQNNATVGVYIYHISTAAGQKYTVSTQSQRIFLNYANQQRVFTGSVSFTAPQGSFLTLTKNSATELTLISEGNSETRPSTNQTVLSENLFIHRSANAYYGNGVSCVFSGEYITFVQSQLMRQIISDNLI